MNTTKEKDRDHPGAKRTTPRPRKGMEKKVSQHSQEMQGEGLIPDQHAEENTQNDQAQIDYAVAFDRQAELEYADEDPDRIRIAPTN